MSSFAFSNVDTLLKAETTVPGSGSYQAVCEVTDIQPNSLTTEALEATYLGSGGKREWKPNGLKEYGEVTFSMHYLATGTASQPHSIVTLYNDWNSSVIRGYQIDFPVAPSAPTGTYAPPTWQFNGFITEINPGAIDATAPELVNLELKLKVSDSFLFV